MTKEQLVHAMGHTQYERHTARQMLDRFLDTVAGALAKGEPVTLRGFGTFRVVQRGARKGRLMGRKNGATAPVEIPPRSVVVFRPSPALAPPPTTDRP